MTTDAAIGIRAMDRQACRKSRSGYSSQHYSSLARDAVHCMSPIGPDR